MATSPTLISPDDVQQDPTPLGTISPDDVQPDAPSALPAGRGAANGGGLGSIIGAGLSAAGATKVGPEIPSTSKAWDIATGHRMPWEPPAAAPVAPPAAIPPAAATPPAGDLVVKFGPTKDSWVGFGPNDPVGPNGETVQQLRQSGWKDEDISKHVQQKGIAPIASPVKGEEASAATPALAPPPGFVEEPKTQDWGEWIGNLLGKISRSEAESVLNTIETAKEEAGGMVTPFLKASAPYVAWQMYKKATGQPNKLGEIPPNAIKALGPLLVDAIGGEGATEAATPAEAPTPAAPAPTSAMRPPAQLPMPVMEGEYMPSPSAGALPPGQYAQPPVPQQALPPGQYAPPAPPTRLALPERGTAIPLPERFAEPREPIIRTTPSEPLEPLRTRELEPAPKKAKAPAKVKAPAKAAVAETPTPPRTAVGAEGPTKGMRLEERGGKWYDTTTGEEYKWQVRRR